MAPNTNDFQPFNRDLRTGTAASDSYGAQNAAFERPASAHPEIFIVAFCGGSTKSINQNIAFQVYQELMTPDGQKATVPNTNPPTDLRGFMTPPLGDGDY
jgi:hypothetical protein